MKMKTLFISLLFCWHLALFSEPEDIQPALDGFQGAFYYHDARMPESRANTLVIYNKLQFNVLQAVANENYKRGKGQYFVSSSIDGQVSNYQATMPELEKLFTGYPSEILSNSDNAILKKIPGLSKDSLQKGRKLAESEFKRFEQSIHRHSTKPQGLIDTFVNLPPAYLGLSALLFAVPATTAIILGASRWRVKKKTRLVMQAQDMTI